MWESLRKTRESTHTTHGTGQKNHRNVDKNNQWEKEQVIAKKWGGIGND